MLRYAIQRRSSLPTRFPRTVSCAAVADISSQFSAVHDDVGCSTGGDLLHAEGVAHAYFDGSGNLRRQTVSAVVDGGLGDDECPLASSNGGSNPVPEFVRPIAVAMPGYGAVPLLARQQARLVPLQPVVEEVTGCCPSFTLWLLRMCGSSDLADDWVADVGIRNEVSVEMTCSYDYNVKQHESAADAAAVEANIHLEADAHEVMVVPRFVAQVVVALHMKLGRGAKSRVGPDGQANVALVRRETARLLREYNVRDMDAAAHLDYIEKCFFEDETHSRLPKWRQRAASRGRFVKWLVAEEELSHDC